MVSFLLLSFNTHHMLLMPPTKQFPQVEFQFCGGKKGKEKRVSIKVLIEALAGWEGTEKFAYVAQKSKGLTVSFLNRETA